VSGVACGQVFTDDELELLLNWYSVIPEDILVDHELAEKIRGYLEGTACAVPR
jgi:hypothetical protein